MIPDPPYKKVSNGDGDLVVAVVVVEGEGEVMGISLLLSIKVGKFGDVVLIGNMIAVWLRLLVDVVVVVTVRLIFRYKSFSILSVSKTGSGNKLSKLHIDTGLDFFVLAASDDPCCCCCCNSSNTSLLELVFVPAIVVATVVFTCT